MNIPTPKFNVKDNVYCFQFGVLKHKIVKEVIIKIKEKSSCIEYKFENDNSWGFLLDMDGVNEISVFSNVNDFKESIIVED